MNEIVVKIFKYVISAAIAVVLLWFSFRGVSWNDFVGALRSCRWEYVRRRKTIVHLWRRENTGRTTTICLFVRQSTTTIITMI